MNTLKLKYLENRISYIEGLTIKDFIEVIPNPCPVCGECNGLIPRNETFIAVPIHNEVYCEHCKDKVLGRINWYEEDAEIHDRRTMFWCKQFGIEYRTFEEYREEMKDEQNSK